MNNLNYVVIAPSEKEFMESLPFVGVSLGFNPDHPNFRVKGILNFSQDGNRLFYLINSKQLDNLNNVFIVKVGNWQARKDRDEVEFAIKRVKLSNRFVGEK